MKVLEANIVNISLASPHACRLCFQEKVFTNLSTSSAEPVITPADVQVPYAIVKDNKEYLIVSLFVTPPDSTEEVKVGSKTMEIYPGKDPKSLHVSFDESEGDTLNSSVTISYRLHKLSVLGTITSPGGSLGYSLVSAYQGVVHDPDGSEVKFKIKDEKDSLIGAGKLSTKTSALYLPVEQSAVHGSCRILFFAADNEQIFECNLRKVGSTVLVIPLGKEVSLLVSIHPLLRPNFYPVMIHDVVLNTAGASNPAFGDHFANAFATFSERNRFLAYIDESNSDPPISNETIMAGVWNHAKLGGELLGEAHGKPVNEETKENTIDEAVTMKGPVIGNYSLIGHLNPTELDKAKYFKKYVQQLQKGMFALPAALCDSGDKLDIPLTVVECISSPIKGDDDHVPTNMKLSGSCRLLETSREQTEEGIYLVGLAGTLEGKTASGEEASVPVTVTLSIIPPTANAHSSNLNEKKKKRRTELKTSQKSDKQVPDVAPSLDDITELPGSSLDESVAKTKNNAESDEKPNVEERPSTPEEAPVVPKSPIKSEVTPNEPEKVEEKPEVKEEEKKLENTSDIQDKIDGLLSDPNLQSMLEDSVTDIKPEDIPVSKETTLKPETQNIDAKLVEEEGEDEEDDDREDNRRNDGYDSYGAMAAMGMRGTPSTNVGIVKIIAKELLLKQKRIAELTAESKARADGIAECGVEIQSLREQVKALRSQLKEAENAITGLHDEKKRTEKLTSHILNLQDFDDLKRLKKEELVAVVSEAAGRFQKLKNELQSVVKFVNEGNKIRKENEIIVANNKKLVDANMQQAAFIQKQQKELGKLETYKNTINFQESVIVKLQAMLEAKMSVRKTEKVEAESAGGIPTHPAIKKSIELVEASGEISSLRSKVAELTEKLNYYENLTQNDAQDTNRKIYRLEAELAAKDVKILALENQLQIAAKNYSDEISTLKMKLFELELSTALDDGGEAFAAGGGRKGKMPRFQWLEELNAVISDNDEDIDLSEYDNLDLADLNPNLFEVYGKNPASGPESKLKTPEDAVPDKLKSKSSWKDLRGPTAAFSGGGGDDPSLSFTTTINNTKKVSNEKAKGPASRQSSVADFNLNLDDMLRKPSQENMKADGEQSGSGKNSRNNSANNPNQAGGLTPSGSGNRLPSGNARNAANVLRSDSFSGMKGNLISDD